LKNCFSDPLIFRKNARGAGGCGGSLAFSFRTEQLAEGEGGGQGLPELAGGDGVDGGVHQAVGQLGKDNVVTQVDVDSGVGGTHAVNLVFVYF